MCMMDWRIGRLIRNDVLPQTIATTSVSYPPNRQRVGLLFAMFGGDLTAPAAARIQFDNGAAVAVGTQSQLTLLLSIADYGSLIQLGFSITNESTESNIFVSEMTLPESYLAAGLEQFESEYARGHS